MAAKQTLFAITRGGSSCYHCGMEARGYVLVGGQSRRMGRDKALLEAAGKLLVLRVAEVVARVAGSVTLLGPQEKYAHLGLPVWEDRQPGCGPLGGIATALTRGQAELSLIVACDLGHLEEVFVRQLLEMARESSADCVLAESAAGEEQPLCAVWRQSAAPVVEEALQLGQWKVRDVLSRLRTLRVRAREPQWMANLNTPADWQAYLAALTPRNPSPRKSC